MENRSDNEYQRAENCLEWIKSLKDRVGCEVNCTTTKEWSEDDKERIKNILRVLDVQVCRDGATGKKGNHYQKEIDWLKYLRLKLSDEQMNAFIEKAIGWIDYRNRNGGCNYTGWKKGFKNYMKL